MKIKKVNEMLDTVLQNYLDTSDNKTLLMIFSQNGKGKYYYDELGKYIVDFYKTSDISDSQSKVLRTLLYVCGIDKYSSIAITFLTGMVLSPTALRKIFGEPIFHNEFGEGFEGDDVNDVYDVDDVDDDDDDDDDVDDDDVDDVDSDNDVDSDFLYASYFVKINGIDFHIGYDNTGTSIDTDEKDPDKVFYAIKKLIDMTLNVI